MVYLLSFVDPRRSVMRIGNPEKSEKSEKIGKAKFRSFLLLIPIFLRIRGKRKKKMSCSSFNTEGGGGSPPRALGVQLFR